MSEDETQKQTAPPPQEAAPQTTPATPEETAQPATPPPEQASPTIPTPEVLAVPEAPSVETPAPPTAEIQAPPPQPAAPRPNGEQYLPQALTKRREKKAKKLEQVLASAKAKGKITNDEVQKLIIVSDRTAQRYLKELEKAGQLKAVGRSGRFTHYLPI